MDGCGWLSVVARFSNGQVVYAFLFKKTWLEHRINSNIEQIPKMDDFKENLKEKTKYNELKIEATADKIQNKASDVMPFNYLIHWSILKECMLLKRKR